MGNSLPEGEIVAIVTVIELDFFFFANPPSTLGSSSSSSPPSTPSSPPLHLESTRCEETNLVLNWEKCHFMVNEGIVLGHKISERGIEVDRAKVEAIEKMPYQRDVKGSSSPALDLDSFPCVEEAIRVADEFCDQYRALKREVEILQEENQRLRRMLEYYSIPSTRPSPPPSDNNKSLQILVQNCKIEKLKLKEILMKREKNPSPSSPKE
ncbi:hypothetical protein QYE76_006321 [Lolium multiflorum]|uniref:Uncharacterized protein n=1 Tax=Lolium multiflorum TaxID=4521 RepID=A0AAD8RY05_LOLMU|nr:hypothetical protein QYE76_006321 [Lolium multiflorum]